MDYLSIDFCGDIFVQVKNQLALNQQPTLIIENLLKDYNGEKYDIDDEVAIYGAIYYIKKLLEVNNLEIDLKMTEIKTRILNEIEYDSRSLLKLYNSFYKKNKEINKYLFEKEAKTKINTLKKNDTFKMVTKNFTNSENIKLFYTHFELLKEGKEEYSVGYFWFVNKEDIEYENKIFLIQHVRLIENYQRYWGKENYLNKFVNGNLVLTNDNKIAFHKVALEIKILKDNKYTEMYKNIQFEEPQTTKMVDGSNKKVYIHRYFESSLDDKLNWDRNKEKLESKSGS